MIDLYLNQRATLKKRTGVDDYNDTVFAADKIIKCRVDYTSRMVRNAQGQQFLSESTVITKDAVAVGDSLVVNGVEYPVLSVSQQADLNGVVLFYEVMV
jgi:hypothetical protein